MYHRKAITFNKTIFRPPSKKVALLNLKSTTTYYDVEHTTAVSMRRVQEPATGRKVVVYRNIKKCHCCVYLRPCRTAAITPRGLLADRKALQM